MVIITDLSLFVLCYFTIYKASQGSVMDTGWHPDLEKENNVKVFIRPC